MSKGQFTLGSAHFYPDSGYELLNCCSVIYKAKSMSQVMIVEIIDCYVKYVLNSLLYSRHEDD